ncbi:MAG TPA: alpha/beta hydrolase [Moraxellaceae bacterium]|nr:alpha/beta hydrolase [Moraxellaceae bacterium]
MTLFALPADLRAWHDAGRYFAYKGYSIYSRVDGPAGAPALLLIHGFPTASWDWAGVWAALAQRYRLYTLDLIGFGFSAKPLHYDYRIADQADLCEAFLRMEGVAEYHVLAHDYGDTVAQELLARQSGAHKGPKLRSVALLNGGLFPETHRPLFAQRLLASVAGPMVARLNSRRGFEHNLRVIFGPDTQPSTMLLDSFWELLQTHEGARVLPRLIRYMDERRQHRSRWVGALADATIPLKLIDGVADPISGAHMAARYRELVPYPDVTELAGIGHYPQCEAPRAVLDAYLAFRDLRTRGSSA